MALTTTIPKDRALVLLRTVGSTRAIDVLPLLDVLNARHALDARLPACSESLARLSSGDSRLRAWTPFPTDAVIAYEAPGVPFGAHISVTSGESTVVMPTYGHNGKVNTALAVFGISLSDFHRTGGTILFDVTPGRVIPVPLFPTFRCSGTPFGSSDTVLKFSRRQSACIGFLAADFTGTEVTVVANFDLFNRPGIVVDIPVSKTALLDAMRISRALQVDAIKVAEVDLLDLLALAAVARKLLVGLPDGSAQPFAALVAAVENFVRGPNHE